MTDHIHPADVVDALERAIATLAAQVDRDPLDPSRLHILRELRDEAQREARK